MKKFGLLILLMLFSISIFGCTKDNLGSSQEQTTNKVDALVQPDRKMDLYGKIISQEGNEYTILEVDTSIDPTFGMETDEKKAYMAKLSEDERMIMKENIRNATLEEKRILIPVGIPIEVKTAQGPDAEIIMGSLDDMTIGSYISVRLNKDTEDRNIAEYIKKSFSK